jgi:hypothetical protein
MNPQLLPATARDDIPGWAQTVVAFLAECRATPLRDEPFCFWHSPETAEEAAEARRVGGLHRRKKKTVGAIYGFHGLRTIEDLQTLLETVAIETLALENTIARNRAIGGFLSVGAKLIEVGELEARLAVLEVALESARGERPPDQSDGRLLGG